MARVPAGWRLLQIQPYLSDEQIQKFETDERNRRAATEARRRLGLLIGAEMNDQI